MIQAIVLIPVRDNARQSFRPREWREWHDRLRAVTGGFTRRPGIYGEWQSPTGMVFRDRSWEYEVGLDHWTRLPAWLDAVRWAQQRFRQEAMYIRVAGILDYLGGG